MPHMPAMLSGVQVQEWIYLVAQRVQFQLTTGHAVQVLLHFVVLMQERRAKLEAGGGVPAEADVSETRIVQAIRLLVIPMLERSFAAKQDVLTQEMVDHIVIEMLDPTDEAAGVVSLGLLCACHCIASHACSIPDATLPCRLLRWRPMAELDRTAGAATHFQIRMWCSKVAKC